MVSPAGSKIPETVVGEFHCNTKAAGWLNGPHPTGKFFTMSAEFEKIRFKLCLQWPQKWHLFLHETQIAVKKAKKKNRRKSHSILKL